MYGMLFMLLLSAFNAVAISLYQFFVNTVKMCCQTVYKLVEMTPLYTAIRTVLVISVSACTVLVCGSCA